MNSNISPLVYEKNKNKDQKKSHYRQSDLDSEVKLRFYGPDPLMASAGPHWHMGTPGELMEYIVGWRWLYAYWDGPLVDEVGRSDDTELHVNDVFFTW